MMFKVNQESILIFSYRGKLLFTLLYFVRYYRNTVAILLKSEISLSYTHLVLHQVLHITNGRFSMHMYYFWYICTTSENI